MSENKNTTISHRALDEIVKLKTAVITDIGQFKIEIIKTVKEIAEKHNELAAQIVAVEGLARNTAAFAASEIGKLGGTSHRHFAALDESVNAIDLNVLALAELAKEVIGQLTQIDAIFTKLSDKLKFLLGNNTAVQSQIDKAFMFSLEEVSQIKASAEKWYGELVASSFKTVKAKIEAEEIARREKEAVEAQEAKAAAEKITLDEVETQTVTTELQNANLTDLTVAPTVSGGSGSSFPEGAEIFGG